MKEDARVPLTLTELDGDISEADVPRLAATARTAIEQRDEAVKWAQHKKNCDKTSMLLLSDPPKIPKCTCGLDDFLATVAQKGGG